MNLTVSINEIKEEELQNLPTLHIQILKLLKVTLINVIVYQKLFM